MINNFNRIRELLIWDNGFGYDIQVLHRSKDHNRQGANSTLIAEWFVSSLEKFNFLEKGIISLCNEYGARAYINLSPKSRKAITFKLLEKCVESVKNEQYSPHRLFGSAVENVIGNPKRWILDVDDLTVDINELCLRIKECQNGDVLAVLPTVNGCHIITTPFNLQQLDLPKDIVVHKNNPTLLYFNLEVNQE